MKRILAIDGGGIRGIIPCRILIEIEKLAGAPISQCFDMIAGTSTGGILACGLSIPKPSSLIHPRFSAQDLLNLYLENGERIFFRPWYKKGPLHNLFDHKYESAGLEAVIRSYYGGAMLSQALVPILVTAYDIERNQPHIFKSLKALGVREDDVPMLDAAMATSAAPTYFPPWRQFIDGGVFAANPVMCAYVEARRYWPGSELFILSLGTGFIPHKWSREDAHGWGEAQWAKPLIDIFLDGNMTNVDYEARTLIPSHLYARIDGPLPDSVEPGMDCASAANMDRLAQTAEALIRMCEPELDKAIEAILTKE